MLLAAGCSTTSEGSSAPEEVVVGIADEILTLDPSLSQVLTVNKTVFDQLTDTDGSGELIPRLATEWVANDDATVWTYTVRDDAMFSDGTPLTVEDIVWTYQSTAERADAVNGSYLANMTSVEATGDSEVTFTLAAPDSAWPRTTTLISIMSQKAYESDPESYATDPLGSGPYAVESSTADGVALVANEHYWGEAPAFEHAMISSVADPAARLNALQAGDLSAAVVAPAQVGPAESAGLTVDTVQGNGVAYLGFNSTTGPLASPELRQAISHAIDRDAIATTLLDGLATPVGQLVAPVTAGYDSSVEVDAFDPELATELVAESGYDGTPLVFQYPTDGWIPQANEVAQAIQGYLDDAGIAVEMQGMDNQSLTEAWLANEFTGMYLFGFKPSTLDSEIVLGLLFGEGSKGYAVDPAIDELITAQRAAADPDERTDLIGQVWTLSAENGYYAPLFTDSYSFATVPEVSIEPRSDGYVLPAEIAPAG
jgi:peptide/nickel transport system substrate-binding protein